MLRAASEPYAQLVGEIALEQGEGLAWWAAEHKEPAFIREDAARRPAREVRPRARGGALPVARLRADRRAGRQRHRRHLAATPRRRASSRRPRSTFLVSSASLVAGAIENARLYEEMRRRVDELEHLTELAEIARRGRDSRHSSCLGSLRARRKLLRADACSPLPARSRAPRCCTCAPRLPRAPRRARRSASRSSAPSSRGAAARASVAVPLVANDELLGLLAADGTSEVDLARAVANQTAVALKKIELIERLTEKNLIKDFFEQLARGEAIPGLEGRAARLGCDLDQRHLVLAAAPPSDELERALAAAVPGSLFDRRDDSMRALLRVPRDGRGAPAGERSAGSRRSWRRRSSIGLSNVCQGAASFPAGFEEARARAPRHHRSPRDTRRDGLRGARPVQVPPAHALRRRRAGRAPRRGRPHRRVRPPALDRAPPTLEEFLRRRGSISATAEALYVHPNTLRQRLRRIGELSGLDLRKDDWLMVEIAVKMVRLQEALGTAQMHTSAARPAVGSRHRRTRRRGLSSERPTKGGAAWL